MKKALSHSADGLACSSPWDTAARHCPLSWIAHQKMTLELMPRPSQRSGGAWLLLRSCQPGRVCDGKSWDGLRPRLAPAPATERTAIPPSPSSPKLKPACAYVTLQYSLHSFAQNRICPERRINSFNAEQLPEIGTALYITSHLQLRGYVAKPLFVA